MVGVVQYAAPLNHVFTNMATKEQVLEDEVEDGEEWPETSDVKNINVIVLVFIAM